jgi:hypothetical protein
VISNNYFKSNNKSKNLFPVNSFRDLFSRKQNSLLSMMYNDIAGNKLSVYRSNDNEEIFIAEMKSEYEDFSIRFLNSIFDVISSDFRSMKLKNLNSLKIQIDSLNFVSNKMLMNKKNANYDFYKSNELNYNSDDLELDLNIKILAKLKEQFEISKLNLTNDSELIQIIDSPITPLPDLKISRNTFVVFFGILFGILTIILISVNKLKFF